MLWLLKGLLRDEEAATTSEYAILVALIAAVVVAAIGSLGNTVNNVLYSDINSILAAVSGS